MVEEALRRGAERVYLGTRTPLTHTDPRVGSLDVLINNAGVALYDDLSDRAAIERSLAVDFYGTRHLVG